MPDYLIDALRLTAVPLLVKAKESADTVEPLAKFISV
jgi:hypothetical protein